MWQIKFEFDVCQRWGTSRHVRVNVPTLYTLLAVNTTVRQPREDSPRSSIRVPGATLPSTIFLRTTWIWCLCYNACNVKGVVYTQLKTWACLHRIQSTSAFCHYMMHSIRITHAPYATSCTDVTWPRPPLNTIDMSVIIVFKNQAFMHKLMCPWFVHNLFDTVTRETYRMLHSHVTTIQATLPFSQSGRPENDAAGCTRSLFLQTLVRAGFYFSLLIYCHWLGINA